MGSELVRHDAYGEGFKIAHWESAHAPVKKGNMQPLNQLAEIDSEKLGMHA